MSSSGECIHHHIFQPFLEWENIFSGFLFACLDDKTPSKKVSTLKRKNLLLEEKFFLSSPDQIQKGGINKNNRVVSPENI